MVQAAVLILRVVAWLALLLSLLLAALFLLQVSEAPATLFGLSRPGATIILATGTVIQGALIWAVLTLIAAAAEKYIT